MKKSMPIATVNGFADYLNFVQEHFPKTLWLEKKHIKNLEKLYVIVYENLLICNLLQEHLENQSLSCKLRFLNDYIESVNILLIAFPVNYPGFSNYTIRVASESLLKFIYSITYPSKTEQQVSKTSFRYLKEELKKHESNQPIKEQIVLLLNIYSEASRTIHKHIVDNSDLNAALNYYVETYFNELEKIIETLDRMIDLLIIILCTKLDFDYNFLTLASKLQINNKLSASRKGKLISFTSVSNRK
jgi:hypothetical protein